MGLYCDAKDVERELVGIPLAGLREALGETRTQLKKYLDDEILPAVELDIAEECGRAFNSVARTYVVPGTNTPKLFVPTRPVTAATRIRLNIIPAVTWYTFESPCYENVYDEKQAEIREASAAATYAAADIIVDVAMGTLTIPPRIVSDGFAGSPWFTYLWTGVHEDIPNVEVDVTTGYSTIPRDIKLCAARMAALHLMPTIDAVMTAGMKQWTVGDEKRSWGANARPQQARGIWERYQYTGIYSEKAQQFLSYCTSTLQSRKMMG